MEPRDARDVRCTICNFLSSSAGVRRHRYLISSVVASRQDGGVKAQSSQICISVWFVSSHLLHLDSMQTQGAAGSVVIAKMTEGFANPREQQVPGHGTILHRIYHGIFAHTIDYLLVGKYSATDYTPYCDAFCGASAPGEDS